MTSYYSYNLNGTKIEDGFRKEPFGFLSQVGDLSLPHNRPAKSVNSFEVIGEGDAMSIGVLNPIGVKNGTAIPVCRHMFLNVTYL